MSKKKPSFITVIQSLYLTINFFFTNDLLSYASACAFGFLFSVIPVAMMIIVILIRFLHASPETVTALLETVRGLGDFLSKNNFVRSLSEIKPVTNFEIVIGVAIVMMARRFFMSVMGGLNKIFGAERKSRPLMTQLISLAGEAVIVVGIATIVFLSMTFKTIEKIPVLTGLANLLPGPARLVSALFTSLFPYIFLFIATSLAYKSGSRTRPSFFTCMLFAAGSTLSFIVFLKIMNLFINVNKYNVIYGVLSNTIVLLMEVFFFFIIFLFFAQWLFVFQFFDTLLLCELYLLPARDETSLTDLSKRLLFIRPDYLLKNELNTIRLKKGDNVYSTGQVGKDAFYVSKGTVRITRLNHVSFADRGCFFGEEACMLRELRNEDATAWTDAEIVRIPEETFFMILDKNPRAASKALSRISNYFAKFYGLTKEYPL